MPVYELTIALKKSNDYRRFILLIHGIALWALFQSTCSAWIAIPIALGVVAHVSRVLRMGRPNGADAQVVYRGGRWFLYHVTGEVKEYAQALIRFDVSLCLRLELIGEGTSHRLMLFHDQLTQEQRRLLHLLQLPHFKSGASCVKMNDSD